MKYKIKAGLFVIADTVLVNISILLAYLLRFDGELGNAPQGHLDDLPAVMLAATVTKLCLFFGLRLYSSLWRYAGIYELVSVAAATLAGNGSMVLVVGLTPLDAPRSVLLITFFIEMLFIGGIRFTYRFWSRLLRQGLCSTRGFRRILVVGGGDAGAAIIKEMLHNPQLKSRPVAVIDDDRAKAGRKINGVPIVGGRGEIAHSVDRYRADEIIIAIPSAPKAEINRIFTECARTPCRVRILPSVSQLIDGTVSVQKVREVDLEDLLGREPVKADMAEISGYLAGRTVLVTGGGGSIGSELCRQIAGFGPKQLIVLDNYENSAYDLQNELLGRFPTLRLAVVIANIRERRRLEYIFRTYRPEVVFHAAAHKHVPLMESNPTEAVKNNVFGTQNVAECAHKYGVGKFVLISTDKAVNPTNIMGATKRIAEMIIQSYNKHSQTEFTAVRFGNVLGSNGSVVPLFKRQIEQGGPVTVTHPEVTRYFMTIPEATQLVIQAGAMARGGEIFVLDMGEPVKIADLARNLIKLSGFEPEVDIRIEYTGLRPGEKLYEELLLAEEGLKATRNNKIFIAQPVYTDLRELKREIRTLNSLLMKNANDMIYYIPNIVPTYKVAEKLSV